MTLKGYLHVSAVSEGGTTYTQVRYAGFRLHLRVYLCLLLLFFPLERKEKQ